MKQRIPRRAWYSQSAPFRRRRVLVEDDRAALAFSDFSQFQQAGFDVAFCTGPGGDPRACPLMRGRECKVLANADVVLHGLDSRLGIAAAIRRRYPGLPVVVQQRHPGDPGPQTVPDGCLLLPFGCSVRGQTDALWRALVTPRRWTRHVSTSG
ncbi:MAG TPA: hypothetical protein VGS19_20710 [Streptosporangiaceae bacterium]|nr:hypothetical protein [Streptosporangiaceae bacterium]